MANALAAEEVKNVRFCLPQGGLADPALARVLTGRGAVVEPWVLYDTEPETADLNGARERFLREGAHWITFTSASTVENWNRLGLAARRRHRPFPAPVSMGPVTSEMLRKLGYEIAGESDAATLDSLVNTIRRLIYKQHYV